MRREDGARPRAEPAHDGGHVRVPQLDPERVADREDVRVVGRRRARGRRVGHAHAVARGALDRQDVLHERLVRVLVDERREHVVGAVDEQDDDAGRRAAAGAAAAPREFVEQPRAAGARARVARAVPHDDAGAGAERREQVREFARARGVARRVERRAARRARRDAKGARLVEAERARLEREEVEAELDERAELSGHFPERAHFAVAERVEREHVRVGVGVRGWAAPICSDLRDALGRRGDDVDGGHVRERLALFFERLDERHALLDEVVQAQHRRQHARRRRVEDQHHPAAALRGRRAQDVALHDVPHEFPQAAGRRAIHTRYVIDVSPPRTHADADAERRPECGPECVDPSAL